MKIMTVVPIDINVQPTEYFFLNASFLGKSFLQDKIKEANVNETLEELKRH